MRLFQVELFKLIKSKKYLIFCVAMITLMILQGYILYDRCENERPQIKLENNEKLLVDYRAKLQAEELSQGLKKEYESKVKILEEENKDLEEEVKNPNYNWIDKITKKNKELKTKKSDAEITLNYNQVEELNSQLLVNNYLLEKDIEPVKPYEINSFIHMGSVIGFVNLIFLPLLIMVLTHDLISGELQYSTVKLLLTKPIKRESIILTKFLSAFLIATLTLILLEGVMFLVLTAFFNMGSPMYPIPIGTKYGLDELGGISAIKNSSYLVPVYIYLLKIILNQVLFLFSATAFGMLISTLVLTNNISLMISSIAMLCLSIITFIMPQKFLSFIYPYLFTTYGDGIKIVSGGINLSLGTTSINTALGSIICVIWGIGFLILACTYFIKKDLVA